MDFQETYLWYEYLNNEDRWAAKYAMRELREFANSDARKNYRRDLTREILGLIADLSEANKIGVPVIRYNVMIDLYKYGLSDRCIHDLLVRYECKRLSERKAEMIITKYGCFD